MKTLGMVDTKWKIFTTSIDLFSKSGYEKVSIKDIVEAVGIKAASVYYHFGRKDKMLEQMYEFLYENFNALVPDLDELVGLIGKMDPIEIIRKIPLFYGIEMELRQLGAKIVAIATMEGCSDGRALNLLEDIFMKSPEKYYGTLLTKMIELDIIEPLNVEAWVNINRHYSYATIIRLLGGYVMEYEE